jgi:hypothetical protein
MPKRLKTCSAIRFWQVLSDGDVNVVIMIATFVVTEIEIGKGMPEFLISRKVLKSNSLVQKAPHCLQEH